MHDDVWAIVDNPNVRAATPVAAIFTNDFWGKRMAENTSHKSYQPLCILTFKLNILLAVHGHGCQDFKGLCCMNLSDHSKSICAQLQELHGLNQQLVETTG
ncbi:transmembrane and tpr repeat-containing protein 1 [Limosa lapponica baueri]|uniref:Transmembrane and tpr repeat-containing protein 1 n=1 Tax=Limosa lapponica baueri TaxID=1758121 RepID=A0A2I0T9E2_LIMLA|nr:transmembrane and tpr repeat-containing protein 1 [Limosa lapponica baueri]